MPAARKQYTIVGRAMDGNEVEGYILSGDGGKKHFTREQTCFLVGRDQVTNAKGQIYQDKLLLRGVGCELSELPTVKVEGKSANTGGVAAPGTTAPVANEPSLKEILMKRLKFHIERISVKAGHQNVLKRDENGELYVEEHVDYKKPIHLKNANAGKYEDSEEGLKPAKAKLKATNMIVPDIINDDGDTCFMKWNLGDGFYQCLGYGWEMDQPNTLSLTAYATIEKGGDVRKAPAASVIVQDVNTLDNFFGVVASSVAKLRAQRSQMNYRADETKKILQGALPSVNKRLKAEPTVQPLQGENGVECVWNLANGMVQHLFASYDKRSFRALLEQNGQTVSAMGETPVKDADGAVKFLMEMMKHYNAELGRNKVSQALDGEEQNHCPLGGDSRNNCEGCPYAGDYYYNAKLNECVKRQAG